VLERDYTLWYSDAGNGKIRVEFAGDYELLHNATYTLSYGIVPTDSAYARVNMVDGGINYDVPEENEYYIHRIGRTGRARKKGISFTLLGSFPEKAKLDEIAKFAGFRIVPMIFDEYGCLVPAPAEEKHPTSRRRF